ncbi:alpha/beta fold hydrolase [Dyadobacter bucti]|uniref:alpha/beta fold hydrolase n=1 Tax=Dyadobacter bucti TaxID=2572203 RepID=UPI00110958D6|nr:alpha/beta hydrolase [Dyadobacter bucti]
MRVIPILICLQVTMAAVAQEKLVSVNGQQFHILTKGLENRKAHAPVLVFENGLGMGLGNWDTVLDELSQTAPVFAYDRAGVEGSERVFKMPTVEVVARNLKAILSSQNIAPPYILVGHSMGGLYIRGFAGYYPDEVAGLVFLDPADFTETKKNWNDIFRKLGVPEKRIDEMLYDRLYKPSVIDSVRFGPSSEVQVLTDLRKTDFAEIASLPIPDVPLFFLIGGKFEVPPERRSKDFDQAKFFEIRADVNIERWKKFIYSSSRGGSLVYLSGSGHYLHRDNPKAVIGVIKMLMESLGE